MPTPRGPRRGRAALAAVLVAVLVAACGSSGPISGVSEPPVTDAPPTASAPTSEPTSAPTDTPTDVPPTEVPPTDRPSGPPDKPTGTTFSRIGEQSLGAGKVRQTYEVGWQSPAGAATKFSIYGVKGCLNASKSTNHQPCVVKGMPIPKKAQVLLAQVPEPLRSTEISWTVPKSGTQPYGAVLIRASNDDGDSIFTIVHSEKVCWRC